MSKNKKGSAANPDLNSSKPPVKDGSESENRISEIEKYDFFEKIDVDSDYDDILTTYEKTLDRRTRAAMKKAGGQVDGDDSDSAEDENVMIEADEIETETDSAEEPEAQQSEEGKPSKKKAKAQKGDASAALYAAITALGLAVGTSFKKLLTGPKKLGRTIVGFFGYIFRFLWLGFKKFVYIISHTFVDQVKGGNIPKEFIPAVQKGFASAMANGALAGYKMDSMKITLLDGSFHPVDSDQLSFEIAARNGYRAAAPKAGSVIMEPIMNVEVVTPEENMGDIIGDLNKRRGQVTGMESKGNARVVKAKVPLSEMFGYVTVLRTISSGRATSSMEFSHFEEVPANIAKEVIEKASGKRKELE